MHYELIPGEAAPDAICRILLEAIDYIIAQLTEPQDDRDKAIHNARKTFKRLRAVLRMARPALGDSAYRQENAAFRDASRLLAALRDSAVLIETLDVVVAWAETPLPAGGVADLRARLTARYEAIGDQLLRSADTVARVADEMRAARQRIVEYTLPAGGFELFGGARTIYSRGLAAMRVAVLSDHDSHLYHEWRKQVKYLWHTFEILLPVWPQLYGYLGEELHVLSGHLGDGHDAAVLRDLLLSDPTLTLDHDLRVALADRLAAYERHRYAQARPLGKRMFNDTPDAFTARLHMAWEVWQTTDPAILLASQHDWLALQLVGTAEAAALLGRSVLHVRALLRSGRLSAVKIGGSWLIPRSALVQVQPK